MKKINIPIVLVAIFFTILSVSVNAQSISGYIDANPGPRAWAEFSGGGSRGTAQIQNQSYPETFGVVHQNCKDTTWSKPITTMNGKVSTPVTKGCANVGVANPY